MLRGDVGGRRLPMYSRGIRQAFARFTLHGVPAEALADLDPHTPQQPHSNGTRHSGGQGHDRAERQLRSGRAVGLAQPWRQRYRVVVGDGDVARGDYSELLRRSVFCLVAPGAPCSSAGAACCMTLGSNSQLIVL